MFVNFLMFGVLLILQRFLHAVPSYAYDLVCIRMFASQACQGIYLAWIFLAL